ncbi:hypothetical protein EVA_09308 [gut metagenome]|uniref:Uncharacterized protein n=1 Tax=gut metagenome TaxID=749906 RepID=J9G6W5_9ZZZZ
MRWCSLLLALLQGFPKWLFRRDSYRLEPQGQPCCWCQIRPQS